MECPHCNREIPGKNCHNCSAVIPLESNYCMDCGINLEEDAEDMSEQDDGLGFENRVLCPDGTCTGIIIDGKCTECGKPFEESR